MSQPLTVVKKENGQLDKVSWELLLTYEALSIIYNSANLLASSEAKKKAASITLTCAIEITESAGGVFCTPNNGDLEIIDSTNVGENVRAMILARGSNYLGKPYYSEGPFENFYARNGQAIQSCLWLPFVMGNDQSGLVYLFSTGTKEYSSIDVKLVETLCCQGALAIRCFMHLDERKEKNYRLMDALADLTKAQSELVRSERLSAIGQMASMIVHDIKNPMGGLLGYAQLLANMSDSLTPEEIREYSGIIIREMQRLSEMTEEIMDFSRGVESELNLREVTPRNLVVVAAPLIESEFKIHNISFQWEGLDDDTILLADTDKMERVFNNLAKNACQAMDHEGIFTISTHLHDDWLEFSIRDTGKGIPSAFQSKIFEPFQSLKESKGLGIGLSVAQWVVEAHKGKILLSSSNEHGTEFKIRLPIHSKLKNP